MILSAYALFHFILVALLGFAACGVLWLRTTPENRNTASWRILFCLLLASGITPTKVPFIFDSWFLAPAAEVLVLGLFDDADVQPKVNLFLVGAFPILVVSVVLFVLLTIWQSRKPRAIDREP
ncbi:MAG: hypothetical protein ACK5GJ_09205 [Planctomycetota bacterium]|jgi:Na+/proline symporter